MMPLAEVNIVAVLVATLATMATGFIWYNPKAFGTAWMSLVGMTELDMQNADMKKAFGTGFLATLISTYFLAVALLLVGVTEMSEAIKVAVLIWLIAGLPMEMHGVAWEKRPTKLLWINASHTLVGFVVGAIMLQWWPA
jgi:hypothetical protein